MDTQGRPEINSQVIKRAFLKYIALGLQNEDAALTDGVSQPMGPPWFRQADGIAPTN